MDRASLVEAASVLMAMNSQRHGPTGRAIQLDRGWKHDQVSRDGRRSGRTPRASRRSSTFFRIKVPGKKSCVSTTFPTVCLWTSSGSRRTSLSGIRYQVPHDAPEDGGVLEGVVEVWRLLGGRGSGTGRGQGRWESHAVASSDLPNGRSPLISNLRRHFPDPRRLLPPSRSTSAAPARSKAAASFSLSSSSRSPREIEETKEASARVSR